MITFNSNNAMALQKLNAFSEITCPVRNITNA